MPDELSALQALRDAALRLLGLEADPDVPDAELTPVRDGTRRLYDSYVADFGPLNRGELREGTLDADSGLPAPVWRRPALGGFRSDPHYLTVMALEHFDQSTGSARAADILLRRVNGRPAPAARVANAHEALLVTLGETGGEVDLARVADLLGLSGEPTAQRALGDLVYRDPERDGRWTSARDYLSDDVRGRREAAARAARHDRHYARNVAALDAVIPPELGPLDISVALGAPWIAATDIEDFVHELTGGRVKVWHLPSAANWRIVPLGKVPPSEYAVAKFSAYDLVTAGLNGRSPVIWRTGYRNGLKVRARNAEATLAAQDRLSAIQERFRLWVWEDAERTRRLCAEYNRRFTTARARDFDGSQLTFPGLADGIELWSWQRDIVARVLSAPASMCGHAVGAGKTRSMVCTAMTARRLGLAGKPLIAVPAHLVEQVAREARQAYPFGRFLVGDDQPRDLLAARAATGDWDAVIVSHGRLASIPVDPDAELDWLAEERAELDRQLDAGLGGRFGRTELRRRVAQVEARVERVATGPRPPVTFESLGVDLLLIDEAHYFKRLPVTSRRDGVAGGSSRRAADLLLKARILRRRRGLLPSLALFTGTPWSNSVAETFVWQTFLQPDVLAQAGIASFDAWAAVFLEYETAVEVTPDAAGIRVATRPSRIRNAPELRAMFARCADVLPAAVLDLDRPRHVARTIVSRPGEQLRQYVATLSARADKIRAEGMRALPGGDNMLVLCTDGRRAALDPRLVGVDEDSAKIVAIADDVARMHHEHAGTTVAGSDVPGVLQVIFCDQGTPGDWGPQTYGRLRIALDQRGVPAARVRWVHEARSGRARAELFARCRDGSVSVLIGSTDTLGTGTNIQTRLRAVHHADAPWRPADVEQREGRALRPGNLLPVVDIVRYVTEGTFDAYMWQGLERKARFVAQLHDPARTEDLPRTIDDIGELTLSYAEVKALAAGNPLLLEHARAVAAVARLQTMRAIDTQGVTAARAHIADADAERAANLRLATMLYAARDRLGWFDERHERDDGPVGDAAQALRERLRVPDPHAGPEPIRAPWRGLGVELVPDGGWAVVRPQTVRVRITLAHRRVDEVTVSATAVRRGPAAAARTVLGAVDDWVSRLGARTDEVAGAITEAEAVIERNERRVRDHRFGRAAELAEAQDRLREIETALEVSIDDPDLVAR